MAREQDDGRVDYTFSAIIMAIATVAPLAAAIEVF